MVVEDGTGKIDSNSYVSLEYAGDYFTSHGVSTWSGKTNTEKEVMLIKATDYIDNIFDWLGKKSTKEQALNFPRTDLYDKDGYEVDAIPTNLKNAVCEAVLVVLQDKDLFKSESENGAVISEHIGSLSFTYDVSQKIKDSTLYESINTRLRGLFRDFTKKKIISGKVLRKL